MATTVNTAHASTAFSQLRSVPVSMCRVTCPMVSVESSACNPYPLSLDTKIRAFVPCIVQKDNGTGIVGHRIRTFNRREAMMRGRSLGIVLAALFVGSACGAQSLVPDASGAINKHTDIDRATAYTF